jgi:hydroxymethylbilane synthase
LKDLPTEPFVGLCLAAVPTRGPSGDVLLSRDGTKLDDLPQRAKVGTGSSRRRSQLWHVRPDLAIEDIRGNVDTRLRKLHEGEYEALVLAEAGLTRLELSEHITQVLPRSIMLPAVGQGALGLETRTDDAATREVLAVLDDSATHSAVLAERSMLAALRGGCLAPVGAWCRIETDGQLHLDGVVLSNDGHRRVFSTAASDPADAIGLGQRVAADLLSQGAGELIQSARRA